MKNHKSGQVALIILLIMVVILTIGLSLISHSVTDISISKDEEEAMRAFSAAEAGIEEALMQSDLSSWIPPGDLDVDGVTPNINVGLVGGSDNIERELVEGEFMNINLQGADGALLNIDWQDADDAALEIVIYQNNNIITRSAVRDDGASCAGGFTSVSGPSTTMAVPVNAYLMRIKVLCNGTTITVNDPSGSLPTQEYKIDSRAAVGGEQEEKISAIEVSRTTPALPPIFDHALFSIGNLE